MYHHRTGKVLNQLRKTSPCHELGKTSSLSSLDRLVDLTATFFDVPLAAVFIRAGHHFVLNIGIDLDACTKSEVMKICSTSMSDPKFRVVKDFHDPDEKLAHADLGTCSSLRFCACLPLESPNGHPIGAFSIADVEANPGFSETDRAHLQAFAAIAVDLLRSRKAERDRRASASALAALGHDIRTPMNGVIGMADLLAASQDLGDKHRQRAQMIKRSGTNLLSMIEPVFDVAKVESEAPVLVPEQAHLESLIVCEFQACQKAHADRSPNLQLTCDLPSDINALVDIARFKKLLSFFFEGAAALSPKEPIIFAARSETAAATLTLTLSTSELPVDDNHLAPIEALLSDEQEPAVSSIGSLGLKLLACRQLAAVMGGDVVTRRLDQRGIRLSVHIRLSLTPADSGIAVPSCESCGDEVGMTSVGDIDVLVAEDDPDMASLIEDFLEDAGHRVTIASSGATVMKILDEKTIDIILMDGQLSDVSGLDVAKTIRELPDKRAGLPIIALTGNVLAGDRERYIASGMNDYLAKPVESEQLIDIINHHCALSRETQLSGGTT